VVIIEVLTLCDHLEGPCLLFHPAFLNPPGSGPAPVLARIGLGTSPGRLWRRRQARVRVWLPPGLIAQVSSWLQAHGRAWSGSDPRPAQGRVYPLACLLAVAVCAFTAAGHDRLTAIGQWIARASQEDLARLGSPVDPWTGLRRVPDESTIRHVLGEIDPASLSRALLGPKRRSLTGKGADGSPSHSVLEYPARRRKDALARASVRLRAVAIDGKTSRGARRGDGTRVHLLGVAGDDGHFIDQVEVDVKSNETTSFTPLLDPLDLTGAVTTFRRHAYGAREPRLAGDGQERPLHRRGEEEPAPAL
jgi:hypothetical protein